MSVLEEVLKKEFSYAYYGLGDLSTGWHIKSLVDNDSALIDYFRSKSPAIINKDDLRDYLVLITIGKYQEAVELLKCDELKPKLQSVIDFSTHWMRQYDNFDEEFFALVNSEYQSILNVDDKGDEHRFDFVVIVLTLIFKQFNRVTSDVYRYINENHKSFIINHFDICKGYFAENISELESVLSEIISFEAMNPYTNIDKFLIENNSKIFNDVFMRCAIKLAERALKLAEEIDEENYLEIHAFIEDIFKLATKFDLRSHLTKFDRLMLKVKKASSHYLLKNGNERSYNIPLTEFMEKLEEEIFIKGVAHNIVFLQLTHTFVQTTEDELSIEPIVNGVFKNLESTLLDFVRSVGIETNSVFTSSIQMNIRFHFDYTEKLISLIVYNKELSELFFKSLIKVLEFISNNYRIEHEVLRNELEGIIDAIVFLLSIDQSYPFYRTYCYGLSQSICSFVEKILRKVYIERCNDDMFYKPESKVTLGYIFNHNSFKEIITPNLSSILAFELTNIVDNDSGIERRIGNNIRNKLMHNYDLDYMTEMNINLVIHLFHILILVINQLQSTLLHIVNER